MDAAREQVTLAGRKASPTMQPRLAMVSIGIRRDMLAPLVFISKFELAHFYQKNVYGDLTIEDFDSSLKAYGSPIDLYRKIVAAQPDILQTVEPFSFFTLPYNLACLQAARRVHTRIIVPTFENRPLDVKFGRLRAAFLRWVTHKLFARACLIIVMNQGARENVIMSGGAVSKIVRGMWGSWGVDTQEFFPRLQRDPDQPANILFVGRLHEEKGVFVLLEAFVLARQEIPAARLQFVGEGPARAGLEKRVQDLGMEQVVVLRGTIKNRNIPELFRSADVFCAPSLTTKRWAEQVGMSALQAMASGVPIVSTQSGAIPEYVPDGVAGILVAENDARALATAIRELLLNPERARQMGEQGRAFAIQHYDARKNVERGEVLVMEHCLASSL